MSADLEGRDDKADEAAILAGIHGTDGCLAVGAGATQAQKITPFRLGRIRWVTRRDMTLRGSLRQPFFDCLLSRQGRMSPVASDWDRSMR